jgi:hypothetical protein
MSKPGVGEMKRLSFREEKEAGIASKFRVLQEFRRLLATHYEVNRRCKNDKVKPIGTFVYMHEAQTLKRLFSPFVKEFNQAEKELEQANEKLKK